MDVSKERDWRNKNRAVLFACDEEAYQQVIALIQSVHGVHIWYTTSSRMRLVVEERGF